MAPRTSVKTLTPLASFLLAIGCQSAPPTQQNVDSTGNSSSIGGNSSTANTPSGGKSSKGGASAKEGGSSAGGSKVVGTSGSGTSLTGGATNGGATNGGATNGGATNGGATNGGATNGGTGSGSSATGGTGSGASTATTTVITVVTPTPKTVTATQTGIHGEDLVISVTGDQAKVGDLLALEVTLLDASSKTITFFDTNLDGILDEGPGRLVLDTAPASTAINGSAKIVGAGSKPVSTVSVKFISITGELSDAVTATATLQSVVLDGENCDPKGITNRCTTGTGCTGTTPKCSSSVLPTFDKLAYLSSASGGTVVATGVDTLASLASVYVEYLDLSNNPFGYDPADTGTKEYSFNSTLGITNSAGTFVWTMNPTADFVSKIQRLRLTPSDDTSKTGAPSTVSVTPVTVRSNGAACDTRGFDACAADSVCWPSATVIAGTCQTIASKQTSLCTSATTLTIGSGTVRAAGRFNPVNLWKPPADCSTPSSMTAPDAVVHLKTTATIPTLLLSTKTPETNVATVVYLLSTCNGTTTVDKCTDRSIGSTSAAAELKLTNVATGDYYVVIENLDYRYGSYGLVVTAQ